MTTVLKRQIIFNIIISALSLFLVLSASYAADFVIKWTAPAKNSDGTVCNDLAGYRVYYGTASKIYIQPKGSGINIPSSATLTYTVTGLERDKKYYFAVTAYDNASPPNESDYSNEVIGIYADTKIIDNLDIFISKTGTWEVSGGSNPYGANSFWSRDGATFSWLFTPSKTGNYEISMWWTTYTSRSDNIPVDIQHSVGTAKVFINQKLNGVQWNVLGTYALIAGTSYKVTITAVDGASVSTCADAVRWAFMGEVTDTIAPGTPTATIYVTP